MKYINNSFPPAGIIIKKSDRRVSRWAKLIVCLHLASNK